MLLRDVFQYFSLRSQIAIYRGGVEEEKLIDKGFVSVLGVKYLNDEIIYNSKVITIMCEEIVTTRYDSHGIITIVIK